MPKWFLGDAAKAALTDAIRSLEGRSGAEVVVAVRARSGSYLHADLAAGMLVAWATLAFMMFSPWAFRHVWFLVDPLVLGAGGALLCGQLPVVRRLLTPASARRRRVDEAARATFYDRKVAMTSRRTGVLVYVSVLERAACVLADVGVEQAVDREAWAREVAAIDAAVRRGEDGTAVAARIRALGALLAPSVPRRDDDVNELPDEVVGA